MKEIIIGIVLCIIGIVFCTAIYFILKKGKDIKEIIISTIFCIIGIIAVSFGIYNLFNIPTPTPTVYTVEKRDFYYSSDNGSTYGDERVDLVVGQKTLMKVIVTVTTNKETKEEISGSITIPNIEAIDAYYSRGQKITPTIDSIENVTAYPFTISTNEEWVFVFEFIPISECRVQVTLDFDEPIPDKYDAMRTVQFVNKNG